jgi:hypothetical protein
MIEWWSPMWDATFVVVFGSVGTWLLVKYGRWLER